MLRNGYHKSFTELFSLMEQWDALRETARVRSLIWQQKPLEEQPDKLDCFYYYLTRAEAAERKGKPKELWGRHSGNKALSMAEANFQVVP